MSKSNVVEEAVEAAGGLKPFSLSLGVKYQAVQRWVRSGSVPPLRVLKVEALTGVSRHLLRPDLYPEETTQPSSAANRNTG
jgi:DNA-binding transcriptional regulator YdaS (Cro superfamily)